MVDITAFRNDDFSKLMIFDNNGTPLDITGYTISFTIRKNIPATTVVNDEDAIIAKVITSHTAPTEGKTTIVISRDEMNIDLGNYYYDIQMKTSANKVRTVQTGKFIVEFDITRST